MIGDCFPVAGRLFQRVPIGVDWGGDRRNPCAHCDLGYYFAKRRKTWKQKRCEHCKAFKCDSRTNKDMTIIHVGCPVDRAVLEERHELWQKAKREGRL